ncbi:MAG: COX15/CtaA family protein [Pseudomonadota bacterium]|nr:COX15/CtaA family protein [Pseudomonadota bacterium]
MSTLMLMQLAAMGVAIATLPLGLVWLYRGADKFRKLCQVTLFMTFDLVVFGGFTRLTDSGLGCPDWPGCYGTANPLQAGADIHAAQLAMPTGPVTFIKAWIEMTHRYLAMSVGLLIVVMVVAAWVGWLRSARQQARLAPFLPMALLGMVCLQGAFGAWTVTMKLQPVIVTSHLLLALSLLALLTWQAQRQVSRPVPPVATPSLARWAVIAAGLLTLQIALGGWVSTNYAALACTDFPLCQGHWVPQMDFINGFTLWRKLGMTAGGAYLPFDALTAIHVVHRSFAFVVAAVIGWTAWRALQVDACARIGRGIGAVLLLQLTSGIATVFLQWPLALAVLHNAGAALLVVLLTMLNYRSHRSALRQRLLVPATHLSVAP